MGKFYRAIQILQEIVFDKQNQHDFLYLKSSLFLLELSIQLGMQKLSIEVFNVLEGEKEKIKAQRF